jgi:outer membrane protein assembly factor BamB
MNISRAVMWTVATIGMSIQWSVVASVVRAGDWPTLRGDSQRRGIAAEEMTAGSLGEAWTFHSSGPPQTAWAGPAKWDAYAHIRGLRAMRNYDAAFGVAVVGQSVFVASSSDDSVVCLDLANGNVGWRFWADGPVRITPTVADGCVYFGSDDGNAYCIDASDGKLIWKFQPPVDAPLILHNGRMISRWPCRTGVLVRDGIAYFAFSLLPWDASFICAVDAKTGMTAGAGHFVHKLTSATIEGAMAATDKLLVAPQGRVPPTLFKLLDGHGSGALSGGGGSFVMVAADQTIHHGPGNKTGWVTVSDQDTRKAVATYKACNVIVIGPGLRYHLSDHQLTAVDRRSNATVWEAKIPNILELVLNHETLFVGGRDEVVALNAFTGEREWSAVVDGDAHLMAIGGGSLLVSTDAGVVHCFRPGATTVVPRPQPDKSLTKIDPPAVNVTPAALARLRAVKVPGMVGHWAFHTGMSGRAKRRGLIDAERRVVDLAGRLNGTILGEVNLRQAGGIEALVLDGRTNSVMLASDHSTAGLPRQQISAEAWVRIDKPQSWGGIIGAIQDNGSYERGWILGYQGSKFCFAVNATGGEDKLTYLVGTSDFKSETWYHVVGTYDGTTQKIFVNGVLENSSTSQSGDINYPPQAFYEIGAYHDKDEYFKLSGMVHEVRVYSRSLKPDEIQSNQQSKLRDLPKPILLAAGPYARFLDRETAEVVWRTVEPTASVLIVGTTGRSRKVTDKRLKTNHRLQIDGLKRNRIYTYRITTGSSSVSPEFELDTTFNFTRMRAPDRPSPYADDVDSRIAAETAETLLAESGVTTGICLVLGADDGRLVYELVRRSDLIVIGVETDEAKVAAARESLTRAGIYGQRATIRQVESLDKLPYTGDFANLIVSDHLLREGKIACSSREVMRVLRPDGGLALIGQTPNAADPIDRDTLLAWCESIQFSVSEGPRGVWARITRGPLKGAGEWSHLYGRPNNSGFGGELLGGVRNARDLRVQWLGRPGPRAQPDRSGRKPSPLSTGGRLFVQGLHRLIGLDAYNGTILWSLEIPPLQRFNVPRDSGNWCADDDHVFVAINNACWRINAQTGEVQSIDTVQPGARKDWKYDWSYIARHKEKLIGSAVKSGSAFVEYWGGASAGWYDARQGPVTFKVCSDNIFAKEVSSGPVTWSYANGVIINSTITVAEDRVYFVECRHPNVIASESRRVGLPELWQEQYLVALDVETGRVVWERPLETVSGIVTYYMAHGDGMLVIAASNDKKYDVYTFDDSNGKSIWHRQIGWLGGKGDHGKAMSRPAIAGGRLYVRPEVMELRSGKTLGRMPGGGCGTYALTVNTAIFRSGNVTLWDSESGKSSSWERLRPGCWLSTIPAGGMLLSPEAGGGCSCGKWMETSIGFMPVRRQ